MFENVIGFFKKIGKKDRIEEKSKDTAKERLHLVLMQDRANVSADFLDMMKQEIIEVIKKYIDVDERDIDVRLTNKTNEDGTTGAPALYANIPITGIKEEIKQKEIENKKQNEDNKEEKENKEDKKIKESEEKADNQENNENQEKEVEEENNNQEKTGANDTDNEVPAEKEEKKQKEPVEEKTKEKVKSNKK